MTFVRACWIVPRHLFLLWRWGQLRFRLETFGMYYPTLPYTSPAWRMTPRVALLLLRRAPAYVRWLLEMEDVRRGGPEGWWRRHRSAGRDR